VTNQDGVGRQSRGDRPNIIDVVGDCAPVERLRNWAVAMPAQAQGDNAVTVVGEEIEEVRIPAPSRMLRAMNK